MHGPGVPNITGEAPGSLNFWDTRGGNKVGVLYGGDSGRYGSPTDAHRESSLFFNANRGCGAYGAGGAQRVRPRAFAALACTYLGS